MIIFLSWSEFLVRIIYKGSDTIGRVALQQSSEFKLSVNLSRYFAFFPSVVRFASHFND
jgi:hypothetical protein